MAEEKYELVHRKVIDTWGQITEEREEGSEEANPEVKYSFHYKTAEGNMFPHWKNP